MKVEEEGMQQSRTRISFEQDWMLVVGTVNWSQGFDREGGMKHFASSAI